ncbi:MAG: sulfur carrier protein ThiS [Firmicutes bacterium]|nr:sulfur carrier protein ThiS [Bacillota bacterium]MBQ6606764.1 sulfur carrier protein ThiS [Bacillota bacterium]MBR0179236.1 sulfur carrier protein ThiS [Bacillota bacterium]
MLKINGESLDLAGVTLAAYLADSPFDARRIAVERNGVIVPKSAYDATVLADGDVIEIVSFVGGG